MPEEGYSQIHRILSMYDRLRNGQGLVKKEEADRFKRSTKSIQRDIEHIRDYIETEKQHEYVEYNHTKRAYILERNQAQTLRNEEIFAILKVLIESRAFPKKEMDAIIEKLIDLAQAEEQQMMKQLLLNEKHLYEELHHQKDIFDLLWQLAKAIQSKKVISMHYLREFDEQSSERLVQPVGIIFSEYYFYLIAYVVDASYDFPTIYRVDRIEYFEQTSSSFQVPYKDRFQEGEFRKRVQFMYTGELLTIRFKFTGPSPQAVLDRLPTATIISKDEEAIIFEAEVFGKGIKMWLLSQGEHVEVLRPAGFRKEMMESIRKMKNRYERSHDE